MNEIETKDEIDFVFMVYLTLSRDPKPQCVGVIKAPAILSSMLSRMIDERIITKQESLSVFLIRLLVTDEMARLLRQMQSEAVKDRRNNEVSSFDVVGIPFSKSKISPENN